MVTAELQHELKELLEEAESIRSLGVQARAELQSRLLNLPEVQMMQVIEQLKEEKKKLAKNEEEVERLTDELKAEGRTLHTLLLNEQRTRERKESHKSSEKILQQLEGAGEKKTVWKKFLWAPVLIALGILAYYLLTLKS